MELNDTTYVGVSQNTTGATLLLNGKGFMAKVHTPKYNPINNAEYEDMKTPVKIESYFAFESNLPMIAITPEYLIKYALFWGVSKKRVYAQFVAYHKKKYIIQRLKRNYK